MRKCGVKKVEKSAKKLKGFVLKFLWSIFGFGAWAFKFFKEYLKSI